MVALDSQVCERFSFMAFICACLVVAIHVQFIPSEHFSPVGFYKGMFGAGVCRAAVPFFFLASGFFLAKHIHEVSWWSDALRKRVKSLLIPFFIWNWVAYIVSAALIVMKNVDSGVSLLSGVPLNPLKVLGLHLVTPLGPLWYVRCLFVFVLLSFAVAWLVRRWPRTLLALTFLFWVSFGGGDWTFAGSGFLRGIFSLEGLFFFSLGMVLMVNENLFCWLTRFSVRNAFGLGIAALFLFGLRYVLLGYFESVVGIRPLAIILMLMSLWGLLQRFERFPKLGSYSFPIYILHGIFLFFLKPAKTLGGGVMSTLLIIIGCIIVTIFVRRCCPRIALIVFGGR